MQLDGSKKILVLGGYGLIGAEVARHLVRQGHEVSALGRDKRAAFAALPNVRWHLHDLASLTTPADWLALLENIDAVVNCAGALQPTPQDDLAAVHHTALAACAMACANKDVTLVQISAVGVSKTASTEFLRTKAAGDATIMASGARHFIIRPGLVLAPSAYGGTLLLRMLAVLPVVQPIAFGKTQIQTVSVHDLARAVALCVAGDIPANSSFDLVEDTAHSLREILAAVRNWLGVPAARVHLPFPKWAAWLAGRIADGLGRLGWRSPMRSTALQVLSQGVRGDPSQWAAFGQPPMMPLMSTLAQMPAQVEDRQFARMAVMMPITVVTLAAFWIVSGIIGVVRLPQAAETLQAIGWAKGCAMAAVAGWSVVDVTLGLAVLIRRYARPATLGMILVSLIYLISASVLTPALWLDPLGPLVKVLPTLLLAWMLRILLDHR